MLIFDVLHKEKVYRSVTSDLRNLGVKHRLKKNAIKNEKMERSRGNPSRKVFKVSLSYQPLDVVNLPSGAIVHVPVFVCQATSYLEKFLFHEGLFRKAGSNARQKELMARLDAGGSLGDKNHAIDVANCLKTFFRSLPEPLIPYPYHDLLVRCLMLRSRSVEALLLACILLPPLHLNTLAYFMGFLKKVAAHESLNKMSIDNLATVVTPNIMPLQETTLSAVQSRLDAHLLVVKHLIENAEEIGVLPEHISEEVAAEVIGSVETELDHSDSTSHLRVKKAKHRSGSLTRMFNGLKKMVGKSSPGEAGQSSNQLALAELDPSHTPSIRIGKKRKVVEPVVPISVKKKRDILESMPKRTNSRPLLTSPVSTNPNPVRETSPVHKSKIRKYLTQKIHSEMRVFDKVEKPKKMRLSLERLYARGKQRIAAGELEQLCQEPYSPCIERRWSSASNASPAIKSRDDRGDSGKKTSSLIRKATTLSNVRDDYDRIFMDAEVNLSDDSSEHTTSNQQRTALEEMKIANRRMSSCRRSLDTALAETTREDHATDFTPKHDKHLRSTCRRLSSNEFASKPCNEANKVDSCVLSKISTDEEYVRIPKSEYEEIKSRVSAIESRISQEFGSIADKSVDMEATNSVSKVQTEYEKTLGEASIESTITADNLAKRLSKELKIRRSSEHKIIRSPSARKIGILRRRSQEKAPSRRVSRNASWHIMQRNDSSRSNEKPSNIRTSNMYQSLKRNRNYYEDVKLLPGDSLCSEETNARLHYLQEQLHTLITHTAEHTRGSLSDEENCPGDDIFQVSTTKISHVRRRASSFHGNEFTDDSRYFNNRVKELKKPKNQPSLKNEAEEEEKTSAKTNRSRAISWKDAANYFKSEVRSNPMTPVPQTGRASIAKLRTQNAGMVLAKARLFDENGTRKAETIEEKKSHAQDTRQGKVTPRMRELKVQETESPRKNSLTRRKVCKSPKNANARTRTIPSPSQSPLAKTEFSMLSSQRESRQTTEKRANRRISQKFDQENRETSGTGNKHENSCRGANFGESATSSGAEKIWRSPADVSVYKAECNSTSKTPHIKRALGTRTPKSARSLARRPIVETRRTPLKAVSTFVTPKRQSPRNVLKSRQLSTPIN